MKFFFRCILHFYDTTYYPVLLIINHYLLKTEGYYYYILNCFERKKNKEIFFLFFPVMEFDISYKLSPLGTICMKIQILFSGKNLINLSSAEFAYSVVSDNSQMSVRNKMLQNYAFLFMTPFSVIIF